MTQNEPAAALTDLTIRDLANRWGLDQSTVWRRMKYGRHQIPPTVVPGLNAWALEAVQEWEASRDSIYVKLVDVANDALNRLAAIVDNAEERGCGFTLSERRQIVSLRAQLDQFAKCMDDIREGTRQRQLGDTQNGNIE